jgi:hypothetical protein
MERLPEGPKIAGLPKALVCLSEAIMIFQSAMSLFHSWSAPGIGRQLSGKRVLLGLALFGLMLSPAALAQTTTYVYTGSTYNTIRSAEDPPAGTYNTEMGVTGCFTTAEPLEYTGGWQNIFGTSEQDPVVGSSLVRNYAFNDGLRTLAYRTVEGSPMPVVPNHYNEISPPSPPYSNPAWGFISGLWPHNWHFRVFVDENDAISSWYIHIGTPSPQEVGELEYRIISYFYYFNWDYHKLDEGWVKICLAKAAGCYDFGLDWAQTTGPDNPDWDGFWMRVDGANDADDDGICDITAPPDNIPPIADAGPNETVHVNTAVNLNGGGSTDPDGNYPLTYSWQLLLGETDITGQLSDPAAVNPTFTADVLGSPDYIARLTVTDSEGLSSEPAEATISTLNTPPVADAGTDQVVTLLGSVVTLDGRQSWDADGDSITYDWQLISEPAGSAVALSDPDTATPSFVPYVYGDYEAALTVNDMYADSEADSVLVSFDNVQPVADAGGDQAVMVGESVILAGAGSDANGDSLTFLWNFVTRPAGSVAELSNTDQVNSSFVTDLAGTYVVNLIVNDGIADSDPDSATIIATDYADQVIENVGTMIDVVNGLPTDAVKNRKLPKAMTNKLTAVIAMVDEGEFESARDKLIHDFGKKMDGCAIHGTPDRNDWVTDCDEQAFMTPMLENSIELLEAL